MNTQSLQNINQKSKEILLVPDLKDAVRDRTSLDDDTLGVCIEQYGGGALLTLRMCMPLVDEIKRRFKNLDKKKQLNGDYKTIRGCRSFQDYCQKVLHRTEQAVYAALRNGQTKKALPSHEPQQDETAAKFLPRLEAIFGKDQVRVALSGESRFRVTLLIDEKDLNIFLEKASQSGALLPAPKKKRLTADERKSICGQVKAGETQAAIAARYGVTQATISNIWRRLNGGAA